jgi:serine/threonine-protein kinase RsbW
VTGANAEWLFDVEERSPEERIVSVAIPGQLRYRAMGLRMVEFMCKLVRSESRDPERRENRAFDAEVISAFGEAFNNLAIHGFRDWDGFVRVEFGILCDALSIRLVDGGRSVDASVRDAEAPPMLSESKMGWFIITRFMDEVRYEPGCPPDQPNALFMKKELRPVAPQTPGHAQTGGHK